MFIELSVKTQNKTSLASNVASISSYKAKDKGKGKKKDATKEVLNVNLCQDLINPDLWYRFGVDTAKRTLVFIPTNQMIKGRKFSRMQKRVRYSITKPPFIDIEKGRYDVTKDDKDGTLTIHNVVFIIKREQLDASSKA